MTSMTLPVTPAVEARSTLRPLAWIEMKRFARHPIFLIGLVFCAVLSAGEHGPIELDYHVIPSFFIGVLGLVVAARLTVSTRRSGPVVDSAPVSRTTRTAALCLACLVPTAAGLLIVLMHRAFVLADPFPSFMYGNFDSPDRFLIAVVIPVIACAGGPLLGVAVGRWLRFPGAAMLTVIALLLWSNVSGYLPTQSWRSHSLAARLLHMAAPYTAFASSNGDGERPSTVVTSYPGSPLWFAVWTVALCGLAVVAALLRGAEKRTSRALGGVFAALATVAVVALALSVARGNQRLYETSLHGTVPVALAAPHHAQR
jgi:hypothetical protein